MENFFITKHNYNLTMRTFNVVAHKRRKLHLNDKAIWQKLMYFRFIILNDIAKIK